MLHSIHLLHLFSLHSLATSHPFGFGVTVNQGRWILAKWFVGFMLYQVENEPPSVAHNLTVTFVSSSQRPQASLNTPLSRQRSILLTARRPASRPGIPCFFVFELQFVGWLHRPSFLFWFLTSHLTLKRVLFFNSVMLLMSRTTRWDKPMPLMGNMDLDVVYLHGTGTNVS